MPRAQRPTEAKENPAANFLRSSTGSDGEYHFDQCDASEWIPSASAAEPWAYSAENESGSFDRTIQSVSRDEILSSSI